MGDARHDISPDLLARVRSSFAEHARVSAATLDAAAEPIVAAAGLMIAALHGGSKILAFGNGGSAADAQHLAAELAGRYDRERPALPALALTANSSDLTAIGNDYGFEQVFARLVEAHGRRGDVAIAISTSGNSENVLRGVDAARARGLRCIGLTGKGGGKLAGRVDVAVVVPSDVTARVQEAHGTILHVLCELVELALFPGPSAR
ncbi:MAG: SIS domain-containing protein [Candidatus Limnocylindria bacterium]